MIVISPSNLRSTDLLVHDRKAKDKAQTGWKVSPWSQSAGGVCSLYQENSRDEILLALLILRVPRESHSARRTTVDATAQKRPSASFARSCCPVSNSTAITSVRSIPASDFPVGVFRLVLVCRQVS